VTLRNAPPKERDGEGYKGDLGFRKIRIFFQKGLDRKKLMDELICPSGYICQPLPLCPEKRTSSAPMGRSEKCNERSRKNARQFTLRRATPYLFGVSALTSGDEDFGEVSRSTVARSMRTETRGSADSASIRAEANCTPLRSYVGSDPGRPI
jgi:hypothetical protein